MNPSDPDLLLLCALALIAIAGYALGSRMASGPDSFSAQMLAVPLGLWAVTMVALIRRGWNDRNAVLAAAACVPPMALVPAVSNDYKLVLCVFPLAVLVVVVATMKRTPGAVWAVLFGAVAFLMIFLARSTIVVAPSLQASKYTLLVALQVLLLVVVALSAQEHQEPAPVETIAPPPLQALP